MDAETCQEKAGFLFAHACAQAPAYTCAQCQKQVCAAHCQVEDDGTELCTSCAKKGLRRERRQRERSGGGSRHHDDWDDRHDPYTYGDRHYSGWGYYGAGYWGYSHYHSSRHHDSDFHEGDAAALGSEGDEAFENDFDAS